MTAHEFLYRMSQCDTRFLLGCFTGWAATLGAGWIIFGVYELWAARQRRRTISLAGIYGDPKQGLFVLSDRR